MRILPTWARTIAILCLSTSTLLAQERQIETRFFPFTPIRVESDSVLLEPVVEAMEELATLDRVLLDGVIDSRGGMQKLELQRVRLSFAPGAVHVDGEAQSEALPAGMSLWTGHVSGAPDQKAFLAISPFGTRGWFGDPHHPQHIIAQPVDGDWSRAQVRVLSQSTLDMMEVEPEWNCGTEPLAHESKRRRGDPESEQGGATFPVYDAPIAFETDFEFYQVFGNLQAAQSYAISLIGAISDLYFDEVGVHFSVPYLGFYTTNNDPWSPGSCVDMLIAFTEAWGGNGAPVRAAAYHLISGVSCGGGVAFLDVLCNRSVGFGVSGGLTGMTPFPPAQGPLTWDFVVVAHELGHQFGAIHTHEYVPPVDDCGNGICTNPAGTLMSYCHTCPGGMSNIALAFHPQSAADIRASVLSSCLRAIQTRNDECAKAQRIYPGPNGPFQNIGASDSQPSWLCGGTASRDLWFSYTADCTGTLTFDTCNAQSDFDTKIEVFSGECGALSSLACNDDFCGLLSQVSIQATEGETYLVRVGGFGGNYGEFVLSAICGGPAQTDYDTVWKIAIKPDKTSGVAAVKSTDIGSCVHHNTGTFTADFIQDGTWFHNARGKSQASVSLADLQRLMDTIYGNGVVTLESFVKEKIKLAPKPGKNGKPGKIKFSVSATLLFNGGLVLKVKAAFKGIED